MTTEKIDPTKPGPDAALAQSDAGPVAQYRRKGSSCWKDCSESALKYGQDNSDEFDWRILYTAPSRPNASAGLIEAAEKLENDYLARGMHQFPTSLSDRASFYEGVEWAIDRIRAPAADRSGPDASAAEERKYTLDEIEAALVRVLDKKGFRARAADRSGG